MNKYSFCIMMIVSLLVSCTEDKLDNSSFNGSKEVNFAVSVDNRGRSSRTLYGNESSDGKSIEVNWVNGDAITVYSPQCAISQADYSVNTNGKTGQNYADKLEKVGSAGIQWGEYEEGKTYDFYAIYPTVDKDAFTEDGSVKVITEVRSKQNNVFEYDKDSKTWVGTPYVDDESNLTMHDALMYAKVEAVKREELKDDIVNLKFTPISTVLNFKIAGWNLHSDMTETISSKAVVYVTRILLQAPSEDVESPEDFFVAGKCEVTFEDKGPKVSEFIDGISQIEIIPTRSIELKQGESIDFSVFTLPKEYKILNNAPWRVVIETENFGSHYFHITPTQNATIEQGQIHKINIPTLSLKQPEIELPINEWIRWIPRNVYLSELSIPGAWYATNTAYQSTTDLSKQFEKGVRAFNIDCRVSYDAVTKPYLSSNHEYSETMSLVCSGTEKSSSGLGLISKLTYTQGETVKSKLIDLITLVKNNPKEFVEVVLTIAEKPKTHDYGTGDYSFGTVKPDVVLSYLKGVLEELTQAYKTSDGTPVLYNKKVDSETMVGDLLGHILVKINLNTSAEKFLNYDLPNVLITEGTMASEKDYITDDIVGSTTEGYSNIFKEMQTREIYWGKTKTNLKYYYHQAQLTGSDENNLSTSSVPNIKDRKVAIADIIDESKGIYDQGLHNALFQLGLGGYTKKNSGEDHETVANKLKEELQTLIAAKLKEDPSPVGVVLMNYATDESGLAMIESIIKMNNKFRLNRNANASEWPDNDNPYYSSGGGVEL